MSEQMTLWDTRSAISSRGLADGPTRCGLPDGPTTAPFGPALAPASHSAQQAQDEESTTSGTCGPSLPASSVSARLQSALESRLRQRLAGRGSPLYALTWKAWAMESGPPICALRARALRTSGSGCSGWPTPITNDATGSTHSYGGTNPDGSRVHCLKLPGAARLVGWPTPCQQDGPNGGPSQGADRLPGAAALAGWSTPDTCKGGTGPSQLERNSMRIQDQALLVGWSTPAARDWKDSASPEALIRAMEAPGGQSNLPRQAATLARLEHGGASIGLPAPMESRGQLNPAHSRWVMGYPLGWDACAATVTRSSRKSPRSS